MTNIERERERHLSKNTINIQYPTCYLTKRECILNVLYFLYISRDKLEWLQVCTPEVDSYSHKKRIGESFIRSCG